MYITFFALMKEKNTLYNLELNDFNYNAQITPYIIKHKHIKVDPSFNFIFHSIHFFYKY